jgi:hypothetical protein
MQVLAFSAKALAIYALVLAISAMFIWGFNGFSEVGQLMMLGMVVVAIPGSIKIARTASLRRLMAR